MSDQTDDTQRTPGRRQPCCISLRWAAGIGYVKRGYMWRGVNGPFWVPWSLMISGNGWKEVSPIHHCPFCGKSLDEPEE